MGKCINHPDRETSLLCSKHNVYMCEECAHCRDPELYCKFRSACPIWFMDKHGSGWGEEKTTSEETVEYKVVFKPDNTEIMVTGGRTLLAAATMAGVQINASCNGKGSCGKCKLILESGEVKSEPTALLSEKEEEDSYILACQTRIHGDVTVSIPNETLQRKLQVAGLGKEITEQLQGLISSIEPMRTEIPLDLTPPTLDDPVSDLDRLLRGLKTAGFDTDRTNIGIKVMRELAEAMRSEDWKVTVSMINRKCSNEILEVRSGNDETPLLGLAIDLGTTSIVVYLVDMADGTIVAATSGHNQQAACGDDVINRIVCSEKDGVGKLSRMALVTINGLIGEALAGAGVRTKQVKNVIISGNTTMAHLLLGIEPRHIRREPYIPTISEFPILKAGEIGIKADPSAAVFVMPGPAGYVGGDIVSGMIYSGLHRESPMTLFIDVGTNGEIVLGNNEWLMTASCSAGPAFEGGGIRWGMRAEEGAIDKVTIDPQTLEPQFSTVGGTSPRGICGSGMIDLLADMLLTGVIDPRGKIQLDSGHNRLKQDEDGSAYIVAFSHEAETSDDITFSEIDIDTLILSKAAVYAGFVVLLNQAGMTMDDVDRFWITGGFGQYLNIEKAVTIGMLPDIDRGKFKYLGNSSAAGAYLTLLSDEHRKEARVISSNMTYIDFSSNNQFMDEFTSARFLPHTDMDAFPSVKAAR